MSDICRILFNGHDFRFLSPVIQYFDNHPDYQVLLDEHPGHVIVNTRKSAELAEKANIIFCEWCLGNAEWYSNHKKKNQKLLIRLHHQEIDLHYLDKIYWENVDVIIFICQNNMRIFLEKFPKLSHKTQLIYNPIDCTTLEIPKLYGAEFNLGFVGLSPKRKAPHRAFEILEQLKKFDKRFTLFYKGKLPWEFEWLWRRPEERRYYKELFFQLEHSEFKNSIVFENYGSDMSDWYSKIGFLLSTSDHEGSHQAVAEGMASGAIPVIRNWPGADLIYPSKYVHESISEAVELIKNCKASEQYVKNTIEVKYYARQNFDQTKILPVYEQLFEQLYQSCVETQLNNILQKEETAISAAAHGHAEQDLTVMHVCYINPNSKDGYVTRVIEETRVLKSAGMRIIIACFVHRDFFSKADQISEHLSFLRNATGAYVHLIPANDFFNISAITEGREEITSPLIDLAAFYHADILHSQSIYSTLHTLHANKQIKAKLVFDVHGIAPEEAEMSGEHPNRINALTEGEKEILQSSDLIVFVSDRMKDFYMEKQNLPFDNSIIIPTCVQSNNFKMEFALRSKKRKELCIDERFVFLYLGTLSPWQWPEGMFLLFAQMYQLRTDSLFFLVLPQADHLKALQLLEKQNLPKESYMIREAPHSEVGSLIGIADAGLLLRKDHPVNLVSSPTKFGEYMAAGIPIITTENIGDISGIVLHENLGLVLSLTDDTLKPADLDRILFFTDDVRENRESWSERCANYARTSLDWALYGTLLQDAYKNLLVQG